jgi:hypothetical protein
VIVAVAHSGRFAGYAIMHDGRLIQAGTGDWFDVCGIVQDFVSTTSDSPTIVIQKSLGDPLGSQIVGSLMWVAHAYGADCRQRFMMPRSVHLHDDAIRLLDQFVKETRAESR